LIRDNGEWWLRRVFRDSISAAGGGLAPRQDLISVSQRFDPRQRRVVVAPGVPRQYQRRGWQRRRQRRTGHQQTRNQIVGSNQPAPTDAGGQSETERSLASRLAHNNWLIAR